MFATITKEQYNIFLTGNIPDSINQEIKNYILSLKKSNGGNAFFTVSSYNPYWLCSNQLEYAIEYISSEDNHFFDNSIML